jgi:hypothetical protein
MEEGGKRKNLWRNKTNSPPAKPKPDGPYSLNKNAKVSINVFVLSVSVYTVDCKKLPSIARLAVKVALTFSKVAVERLVTEHTCKACFMVSARTVLVSGHKYVKQMDSAR